MKTQLQQLRSGLGRLQSNRKLIRWANGYSLLATAVAAILLFAFFSDWVLDMTTAQRVILFLLSAGAVVWAYRRFTFPWLIQREDIVDVALLVERQQKIDSDLVSALQFEDSHAENWGSTQLKDAVIEQVAKSSKSINVFEGFSFSDFKRRVITATIALLILVGLGVNFPGYFGAFFNRMAMGSAQYPTATHIDVISVNQHEMLGKKPQSSITSPYGHPILFTVQASGELPADQLGRVHIRSVDSSISTDVELKLQTTSGNSTASYTGELPRLMDSVTFEVYLGDARSRSLTINAIPLPVVEVDVVVTPPEYAVSRRSLTAAGSTRQISVLEGSRVDISATCLNKELEWVKCWIGDNEYTLVKQKADKSASETKSGSTWTFNSDGTELESVTEPLKYRIEALDKEGLGLESPIHGTIRLKTDQAPRTAISLRTRRFIPTGKPPIKWSASDDYGLSKVLATVQVAHADGTSEEKEIEIAVPQLAKEVPTNLEGLYRLDLEPFKLVKGDELKLTFRAYDYRGKGEPKESFSEPLILQVTDRQGIVAGLLETDEESAKQLDAIIRRELGIGGSK
jgi:hypothetical protein